MGKLILCKIWPGSMAGIVFVELLLDGINSILTKCAEPTALISGSSVGKLHIIGGF